ncbi:MAG: glycoside hydrolase family 99-like domain-containing protein, partial [Bacillota bacterium]
EVKVGAYYFDGWSGKTNSTHLTERLQGEFGGREPVWGWFDNTIEVMERQIDLAGDQGIGFFSFCWYWPDGEKKETPLNNALELYLKAKNRGRVEFCLMVANHGGFRVGPRDWEVVSEKWIELFKEPGYLMVEGKPLLVFFSPRELKGKFGGVEGVRKALDELREKAKKAGLKGVTVAACCTPGPEWGWDNLKEWEAAGFDVLTGYNYPGAGAVAGKKRQTFASMVEGHVGIWEAFPKKSKLPYIPAVTTGWDKRPWEKRDLPEARQSVYYPDRSPAAVRNFIGRAIAWVKQHPEGAVRERLVVLYAWNENGEGGYLTPTKGDGDAYLKAAGEAIRGQGR